MIEPLKRACRHSNSSHGCVRLPKDFSKELFSVTQLGTPVIIADQNAAQSSVVRPDLILRKDVTDVAQEAEAKTAKSRKSTADVKRTLLTSILVSGGDHKAYLIVDGAVTFETPINVSNRDKPMGTHLFSLIGLSPDGYSYKWRRSDWVATPRTALPSTSGLGTVLGRTEYLDGPGIRRIAHTLHPGNHHGDHGSRSQS